MISVIIIISSLGGFYLRGSLDNNKKQINNLKNYNKIVNAILYDFNLEGWKEIIGKNGSIVVVPDKVAGKQDGLNSIYAKQKNFIFKNSDKGVVILLNISATEEGNESKWHASIGYDPIFHNSKVNRFKDSYSANMPNSEVYLYNFAMKGCNINIVAISENPKGVSAYTVTEAARFSEKIAELINKVIY